MADSKHRNRRRQLGKAPAFFGESPSFDFTNEDHLVIQRSVEYWAYALWQERGGPQSDDWSDWFRAEAEVLADFCQAYQANY